MSDIVLTWRLNSVHVNNLILTGLGELVGMMEALDPFGFYGILFTSQLSLLTFLQFVAPYSPVFLFQFLVELFPLFESSRFFINSLDRYWFAWHDGNCKLCTHSILICVLCFFYLQFLFSFVFICWQFICCGVEILIYCAVHASIQNGDHIGVKHENAVHAGIEITTFNMIIFN